MRPGPTWLGYWILGVLLCEGLGQLLWVATAPTFLPPTLVRSFLGSW